MMKCENCAFKFQSPKKKQEENSHRDGHKVAAYRGFIYIIIDNSFGTLKTEGFDCNYL